MKKILSILFLLMSVSFFANEIKFYNSDDGLVSDEVFCVDEDKENKKLWMATNVGVYGINNSLENISNFNLRNTTVPVLSVLNDEGFVWVGVQEKGLYKMNKSSFEMTGFFRDVLGRKSVVSLTRIKSNILGELSDGYFSIDLIKQSCKLISKEAYFKLNTQLPSVNIKGDTLFVNDFIYLGYNAKEVKPLYNNQELTLIDIDGDIYKVTPGLLIPIFDADFKAKLGEVHHVFKLNKKEYILSSSNGMTKLAGTYINPKYISPVLKLKSTIINNEPVDLKNKLPNINNGELKVNFSLEKLGKPSEILWGWSYDKQKWEWGSESEFKIPLNPGNQKLYFKAKNIRNFTTPIEELTYSMASPSETKIWRIVWIIIGVIFYSFLLLFIVVKKKNKEIALLEEDLLEKTNRLNQLEMPKYNLKANDQKNV